MKKLIVSLVLFLFSICSFGQTQIDQVPIQLIDNLIFIEITINDSPEPLNFMFDTGAGVTVIETKIAERLQLDISGELKIGTSGKSLQSKLSQNNNILIGEKIQLHNTTLLLMDLSHISDYFESEVDGIIGIDLLTKVITETNIDAMEMRFFSSRDYAFNGNTPPLKLIELESAHIGLPIEVTPKGSKKSIPLIVKIDSGAGNFLTFHNTAVTEYQLINPNKKYKTKKGFGVDSTITKNLNGRVSSAVFGNKIWKNIPVVFEVDPINASNQRQADGLIGQEMLLAFNITYNLNASLVYLEKR